MMSKRNNDKKAVGDAAEQHALAYLLSQGLELVAQNWQVAGVGEIDLIMRDTQSGLDTLVFVEVRYRQGMSYGGAKASITSSKRAKIVATAQYFLAEHADFSDYDCRFDVVVFQGTAQPKSMERRAVCQDTLHGECEWIPAAFM